MLNRYFITLGAPTTAGGKVTSANDSDTIDGVPLALEGDTCWCPACLSEGVIRPDGPRLSDTFEGRQLALADDLCICKCSPPPRLLAAQTVMYQSIDNQAIDNQAIDNQAIDSDRYERWERPEGAITGSSVPAAVQP